MASSESETLFYAARLKAIKRHPYFTSVYFALIPIEKAIGTLAVDKQWRCYYDPEKIKEWGVEKTSTILLHEIGHLLRDHHKRVKNKGIKDNEFKIANICEDLEINDDIVAEGINLPTNLCLPKKFNLEENDIWENYFDVLIKKASQLDLEFCSGSDCKTDPKCPTNLPGDNESKDPKTGKIRIHVDCGSCAGGDQRDYEDPEDPLGKDGILDIEQELIRRQIAREIQDACSKNPGNVPLGWKQWADATLKSQVRWDKELRASIRNAAFFRSGCEDYTYKKPSRRQNLFPDIVKPSMHKPTPDVAIVIDTSGSMDKNALEVCLSETKAVLKSSNLLAGTTVLTADTQVHFAKKVVNVKQIELLGGGGTDMVQPLKVIASKKHKPSVVIVMTDGYTPWPDHNLLPKSRVIALLIGNNSDRNVPTWMKKIVVDTKSA